MLKEFKEFAVKGNALELAIGVIIGGAFQNIVKSLVNDIIMPLISLFIGNVDFSDWVLKIGNKTIPYGSFISAVVNFLIIAFSLFLVVKYFNKLNKKLEEAKFQEVEKIEKLKKENKIFKKFLKKKHTKNEAESEHTTKLCPYCYTQINYKATRCPYCTSKLDNNE